MRQFQEKDLEKFSHLFNTVYKDYSLYNVRTPAFYQYLLLQRPRVGEENIFVAEEKGNLVGFCAIGIREAGAATMITLYEMVATTEEVIDALMTTVEAAGKKKNAAYIETVAPLNMSERLKNSGFVKGKEFVTMGFLIQAKEVVTQFVEQAQSHHCFKENITFLVGEEMVTVTFPEGIINSDPAPLTVRVSPPDLLALLFKKSSFWSLLMRKRIIISPFYKVFTVYKIIVHIAQSVPMMTPLTERM